MVVDGPLNLRAAAGADAEVLDVMPDGTVLYVQSGGLPADGYTWYLVSNSTYGRGYATGEFLQPVSGQ